MEKFYSDEELEREANVIIADFRKSHQRNMLKVGAMFILMGIFIAGMAYAISEIPKVVHEIVRVIHGY